MGDTEVICSGRSHRFPVVEGIPVMTDEEALRADPHYDRQRTYFAAEFAGYGRYELEPWRKSYLRRLRRAGILDPDSGPLLDVGVRTGVMTNDSDICAGTRPTSWLQLPSRVA